MTPSTFYLDESGNTGGLTSKDGLAFGGQPLFVLACLGVDDLGSLQQEVEHLRNAHRIQAAELKFSAIRRKPDFAIALLEFVRATDLPVMIEAVDKRFVVCTYVIECLIMPPYSPKDFGPEARAIKNVFADYLAHFIPDAVLLAFIQACERETHADLAVAFAALNDWLAPLARNDVTDALRLFASDTYTDFKAFDVGDRTVFDHYLPVPDTTRRGNRVWMLSHVTSLINIYARINMMRNRDVSGVRLVHDEQMQFDAALTDGKALSEGPLGRNMPPMPMADFSFDEKAQLEFRNSDAEFGIQLADLLAGMVSHCARPFMKGGDGKLPDGWTGAMRAIARLDDERRARGTNFVISTQALLRLKQCYA